MVMWQDIIIGKCIKCMKTELLTVIYCNFSDENMKLKTTNSIHTTIKQNLVLNQRAATHDDTVLLVGFYLDYSDVTDLYAAQRAKEAGLTILMACQQLPVCHHQATWDTWRGDDTLGHDLQVKCLQVMDRLQI